MGSKWRVGHLSRLGGVDLYREVYNTLEGDPGKVNCQAEYKPRIFAVQTVPCVLGITLHLSVVLWSVGCFYRFWVPSLLPLMMLVLYIWKVCFQTTAFLVVGFLLSKGFFFCRCWGTAFMELHWAWNTDPVLATTLLWTHCYFKLKWLRTYGKLVKNLNY